MHDSQIYFSVIVPCYNSEKYIKDTIRSLDDVTQLFREKVEIIFVDDGSSDSTLQLLTEACANNSTYRLVSQKNNGVSSARNAGIKIARGSYILFLDSDDKYRIDMFRILFNSDVSEDIIFFGYEKKGSTARDGRLYRTPFDSSIKTSLELLEGFFTKKVYLNICALAVNRQFLIRNNILFDEEIQHCEDIQFIVNLILKSDSFKYVNEVLFTYNFTLGSAVNSRVDEKHFSKLIAFEKLRNKFIEQEELLMLLPDYDYFVATVYLLLLKSILANGIGDNKLLAVYIEYSYLLGRKMNIPVNAIGAFVFLSKVINFCTPKKMKLAVLLLIVKRIKVCHEF